MFEKCDRELLIHDSRYALSRIIEDDRSTFVELQRQVKGDDTFYLNPLSKDLMWDGTVKAQGLYVIIDEKINFCGTIELLDDSNTPEIGISILEKYKNKGIAKIAVGLLIKLTYNPERVKHYLIRIESGNLHSQHVFEKMGAEYCGEDLSTLERFQEYLNENRWEEKYKDILSDAFFSHEGDSKVLIYKLLPEKFLAV